MEYEIGKSNEYEIGKVNWVVYYNKEQQEVVTIPFVFTNRQYEVLDIKTKKLLSLESLDNKNILKQYKENVEGFEPLNYLTNGPSWGTHHLLNFYKCKYVSNKNEVEFYKSYNRKSYLTEEDIDNIKLFMEGVHSKFLRYTAKRTQTKTNFKKDKKNDDELSI